MGHHDIAFALKTRTVVKTDIAGFETFAEDGIGNLKNGLKE
jgi:hypothetical protein